MAVRSLHELQETIDCDLAWRKHELSYIKSNILSIDSNDSSVSRVLIRSAITMLYAHWEGAVKHMATAYLTYVSTLHLPYSDLKLNFYVIPLKGKLKSKAQSNKMDDLETLVEFVLSSYSNKSNIPVSGVISAQSNLSSDVFVQIMLNIGLEYTQYETKFNLLDEHLLKMRNNIAHGDYFQPQITPKEYTSLHDTIIKMLTDLSIQIFDSAMSKAYLKSAFN